MNSILVELARLGISWEAFWKIKSQLDSLEDLRNPSVVESLKIHPSTKRKLLSARWDGSAVDELGRLGIGVVGCFSEDYPKSMFRLKAPPYVLFYKGDLSFLSERCVAIVGSRKASAEGRELARVVARGFASGGFVVVSGLALGIDSYAHRGAVEVGKTIAVMGSSLDWIYPPENRSLYYEIVDKGLVISPFFPGTPPKRYNFPLRNRIIAAISERVLVVEAGCESGALITAKIAFELGIPVSVCDIDAPGNRKLLLEGADLFELGKARPKGAGDAVLRLLADKGPLSVDDIAFALNIDIAELQAKLLELELEGKVRRLPGGFYKKA